MDQDREKWAILGASRGLGRELVLAASRGEIVSAFLLSSRKLEKLKSLSNELSVNVELKSWDFTLENSYAEIFQSLADFAPARVFYIAGGGPYGFFEAKEWKDHLWAYKLNLLFPAQLLQESFKWPNLKQLVFCGSSIAESKADPLASSYASAKHGLKGLISSVKGEAARDLRLYSPGYMSTEMLPANAKVRQLGQVWQPKEVAADLLRWCQEDVGQNFHRELPAYSGGVKHAEVE